MRRFCISRWCIMALIRATVALVSDTHGGGTTALMPPAFTTGEGVRVEQNRYQAYLWECWTDYCQQVKAKRRTGAYVYGVYVGDITEGRHHDTVQIISASEEDHVAVGVEILNQFVPHTDLFACVRGTPAHAGAVSTLEERVVREFRSYNLDKPAVGFTHKILRAELDGVRLNLAHHISGGTVRRITGIEGAVKAHLELCGELGETRADYLVRAHKHRWADTAQTYRTRGFVLPAWQFPTEYVYRFAPESAPSIGGAFIDIYSDGTHTLTPVLYPFLKDERQYTVIKINNGNKAKGKTRRNVYRVRRG
jgi:hypothetical protein